MLAEQAALKILTGRALDGMSVEGVLDLRGVTRSFRLPSGLSVDGNLLLSGSAVTEIPDNVSVSGGISASRCSSLVRIGSNLRAKLLEVQHCGRLETVGGPLNVTTINFEGCTSLARLPERIKGTQLSLRGCAALESLPDHLNVSLLHLDGCRRVRVDPDALDRIGIVTVDELTALPYDWRRHQVDDHLAAHWLVSGAAGRGLNTGTLSCANNTWLRSLPERMIVRGDLNLEGCTNLAALPADLTVNGTLTLTGCRNLREIPASLRARKLILPDGRAGQGTAPDGSFLDLVKSVAVAARVIQQLGTLQKPTIPRQAVSAADARTAILAGEASVVVREDLVLDGLTELQALPNRLWVFGNLTIANLLSLRAFPRDFRVTGRSLRIEHCPALEQLPALSGDMIFIEHCPALAALPAITCDTLSINHCDRLETVPDTVAPDASLWVSDCAGIGRVSDAIHVRNLSLRNLPLLERVPASPATRGYTLEQLPLIETLEVGKGVRELIVRQLARLRELPDPLELVNLEVDRCPLITALPGKLCASRQLSVIRSPITTIPRETLTLSVSCREVETLETIDAGWQDLRDLFIEKSPALKSLPPGLRSIRDFLVLDGCAALTSLPEGLSVSGGVSIRWCTSLRRLPPAMPPAQALELFRSGLESIPKSWAATKLSWHRRVMSERQLFQTGTYRIEELLGEADKDLRRILIDRYPLARLVSSPRAAVLDEDRDGDTSRRLIQVLVPDDEAVVALVTKPPGSVPVYRRVAPQVTKVAQAVYALNSVGEYRRWG